jgi:type I restriction enzyme, R subunit
MGVDARNVRHIVLMRPTRSMIEFKQIIGPDPARWAAT